MCFQDALGHKTTLQGAPQPTNPCHPYSKFSCHLKSTGGSNRSQIGQGQQSRNRLYAKAMPVRTPARCFPGVDAMRKMLCKTPRFTLTITTKIGIDGESFQIWHRCIGWGEARCRGCRPNMCTKGDTQAIAG